MREHLVAVGHVEMLERRDRHGLHLLLKRASASRCEMAASGVAEWGLVV
jgi:hypothetical protein